MDKEIVVCPCSGYCSAIRQQPPQQTVKSERSLRQRLYDTVGFHLYDLLEKAKLQRQDSEHVSGCQWFQWLAVGSGTDFKRTWRNLVGGGDRNILHFDCGGGYMIK